MSRTIVQARRIAHRVGITLLVSLIVLSGPLDIVAAADEHTAVFPDAVIIPPGSYSGSVPALGGADVYAVSLNSGDELFINVIRTPPYDGPSNFGVALYGPSGTRLAYSGSSYIGSQVVSTEASEQGLYYLEIGIISPEWGGFGAVPYTFSVAVTPGGNEPSLEPPDAGLPESNGGYDYEEQLEPGVYATTISGPTDVDIFAISLERGDELTVKLVFDNTDGDLDLYLDDPDFETVAMSSGIGDSEQVSTVASQSGLYYVWIQPYTASGEISYTLVVEVSPEPDEVSFEPNDVVKDADGTETTESHPETATETTTTSTPGFGGIVSLVALIAAALLAIRRID